MRRSGASLFILTLFCTLFYSLSLGVYTCTHVLSPTQTHTRSRQQRRARAQERCSATEIAQLSGRERTVCVCAGISMYVFMYFVCLLWLLRLLLLQFADKQFLYFFLKFLFVFFFAIFLFAICFYCCSCFWCRLTYKNYALKCISAFASQRFILFLCFLSYFTRRCRQLL